MPDAALPEQELLFHLLGGFIRGRWLFVTSLALAVVAGTYVFHVEFPVASTIATGVVVVAYNVVFTVYHRMRRGNAAHDLASGRIEAAVQIGLDLVALSALVHFTGGAQSPFICLYVIHTIAGSLLLSRREAWFVAVAAFALFVAVAALEYEGIIRHYHPTGLFEASPQFQRTYDLALALAFGVALFGSVFITTWTMNGLRMREQQLVLIQQALVKNSDDLERAYASLSEQQAQLIHAEKQASLGRLVAGIAHEINNPIQFIHGNMTVLSEAFTDVLPMLDEQHKAQPELRIARLDYPFFRQQLPVLLKDMADGAARIRAIVRDLRTFARRDEGRLDETVDLTEVVQASVRLLHNQLKHLSVEQDLDPDLPKLRGNVTQLQQVVVNALQNACQAMKPNASGLIRVRTRAEQGGGWVRLTVEDNGCGIAADVLDRIFDPFFTTKQRSGGTGLGLAITDGIIQQHKGHIEVDSQVGKGTAFHFLLPVRREGSA